MITLYQFHWSHYCEKVRLALNFMGLSWQAVDVDPFNKTALHQFPLPDQLPAYTVPAIKDSNSEQFTMDSTPVLRYLAKAYPDAPKLFPGDSANQVAVDARLIEFDSKIGIPARRLAYTQLILENPAHLTELFLKNRAKGLFCLPLIRSFSGAALGMILTKRFDFHLSETLGLYEGLEEYLVELSARLEKKAYVVNDEFSAADLSLAAFLRPLTIIPFFYEHPKLQRLFERHRLVVNQWSDGGDSSYQAAIASARLKKPPMRRKIVSHKASLPFAPHGNMAENDQNDIIAWSSLAVPYQYFVKLRRNKLRRAEASAEVR